MKTAGLSLKYKRKRQGRTNYRKRLTLLTGGKNRLVIRKSLKHITAQFVRYNEDGDKVLITAHSKTLEKNGWTHSKGSVPAAYLTGILLAHHAKKQNIREAIVDSGIAVSVKGSRIYAVIRGVIDSGITVPCDKEMLPSDERIQGKHLKNGMDADINKVKEAIQTT